VNVTAGTDLATIALEVRNWSHDGGLAQAGSVFDAGSVGPETAGGVTENPAIWAHPPNASRTLLSWVLRLPAAPLKLGWSAGVIDGACSDDGVDFAAVATTAACSWSAASNAPWLTITAGTGSGNGTVNYTAAANAGPARIGMLTIAGQTLVVTQAGLGLPFADGPLAARTSVVRAAHITELRSRINALRALRGLPAYSYSNPSIAAGSSVIRAQDITEMRQALQQVYAAGGLTLRAYSTVVGVGGVITIADIMDLCAAVVAIEW
jgi:all-beta uncharacterized protein